MICPLCHAEVDTHQERIDIHGDCPGGFALAELAETKLESRYTDARADCPHPERWHSDDWDSTEHEVTALVAAFVGALRPERVLETGTAFGQTAYAIGAVLAEAGVGRLVTIEPVEDRCHVARKRVKGLPVEVIEASSLDVPTGQVAGGVYGLGFAWFDSLLPLRVPEFRHFYPAMAPGAFVGFHDVGTHHDYGKLLWNQILELEDEGLLLPIRLPTPRGVVFAEVVK